MPPRSKEKYLCQEFVSATYQVLVYLFCTMLQNTRLLGEHEGGNWYLQEDPDVETGSSVYEVFTLTLLLSKETPALMENKAYNEGQVKRVNSGVI